MEWRPVVEFEGLYEVSNTGIVRSIDRYVTCKNGSILFKHGRIIKQFMKYGKSKIPRYQVNLCKNCKNHSLLVSRIVAKAFLDNPFNLPQVNHKDENPANNNVDNLEWCTAEYNHNYGTRNQRQADSLKKQVEQYDLNGNYITSYNSIKEAAEAINGDPSCIAKVCKGKYKYHRSYIFKYK